MMKNSDKNSKLRIYVSGNELVEIDSYPLKILPDLKKAFNDVEFILFDPTEDFPDEKNMIIIDTIINIKKVTLLENPNLERIQSTSNYSVHDYDFATNLKLMKKLGKLKEFTIIGVPPENKNSYLLEDIKKVISNLLSRNE